jgi:hypothetical protein
LTSTPPIDLWKEIIKLFQHYITTSAIFCIEAKEESGEPEGQKIRAMQSLAKGFKSPPEMLRATK